MEKITEQPSHFDNLEQMSVSELLQHINEEDLLVAEAVRKAIPQIVGLVCSMPVNCLQPLAYLAIGL